MPTTKTLPTRRDDYKTFLLRVVGLLLFIAGMGELVYIRDQPTVAHEEKLPDPQETEITTPTGDRIKVTNLAVVTVRINPILIVGAAQTVIGLVLLWLAPAAKQAAGLRLMGTARHCAPLGLKE